MNPVYKRSKDKKIELNYYVNIKTFLSWHFIQTVKCCFQFYLKMDGVIRFYRFYRFYNYLLFAGTQNSFKLCNLNPNFNSTPNLKPNQNRKCEIPYFLNLAPTHPRFSLPPWISAVPRISVPLKLPLTVVRLFNQRPKANQKKYGIQSLFYKRTMKLRRNINLYAKGSQAIYQETFREIVVIRSCICYINIHGKQ